MSLCGKILQTINLRKLFLNLADPAIAPMVSKSRKIAYLPVPIDCSQN